MTPILRAVRLAAALVVLATAAPALAATPKNVLPVAARTVDGGRQVEVVVAQSEIKSAINASNLTVYAGGGLLWAIVDAAVDAERAKKAEAAMQPIRAALTGFDADALAMAATKAGIEATPWFSSPGMAFTRDSSPAGLNKVLDASPTRQMAIIDYAYDASPDFGSLRVVATVRIVDATTPKGKKPEWRLDPRHAVYLQPVTSVVTLLTPSKDAAENARRWAADDGKLARKGLTAAFEEIGVLLPRSLDLQAEDMKKMRASYHAEAIAGGYRGRVQEQDATTALLFTGGLVHARTILE